MFLPVTRVKCHTLSDSHFSLIEAGVEVKEKTVVVFFPFGRQRRGALKKKQPH